MSLAKYRSIWLLILRAVNIWFHRSILRLFNETPMWIHIIHPRHSQQDKRLLYKARKPQKAMLGKPYGKVNGQDVMAAKYDAYQINSTVCSKIFQLTPKSITVPHHWFLMWGIHQSHRSPVDFPHKGPSMRKMFPFHDIFIIKRDIAFPRDAIYQTPDCANVLGIQTVWVSEW